MVFVVLLVPLASVPPYSMAKASRSHVLTQGARGLPRCDLWQQGLWRLVKSQFLKTSALVSVPGVFLSVALLSCEAQDVPLIFTAYQVCLAASKVTVPYSQGILFSVGHDMGS